VSGTWVRRAAAGRAGPPLRGPPAPLSPSIISSGTHRPVVGIRDILVRIRIPVFIDFKDAKK
jgi:hypothetical protein